jgi:hypothetical protein
MPKGNRINGRGEFGGEDFQRMIRVGNDNDRVMVIHGCFPLPGAALREPSQTFVSVLGKPCGAPPLLTDAYR